ncbi:hypothetical protein EWM64_g1399 [Hericium alpestre]|uniref:Uncharacterized protein n=1 Tax=Hericium alpestre TaxID=135208 RepID=A0A4Z0A8G8_9AGAM|nr:hypothetical protein EWM64_g1399 [Hericium alpestre]
MLIDLSLDRIRVLLTHLPQYSRPTIHIAGTNGKGSVSSLVSSILRAGSLSVGRFNSPHLVSVLDSINVNGHPVSSDKYNAARKTVEHANDTHSIGATSFEVLTCTALLVFEREAVDMVVLEAGMGGRLDATNVIPDECVLVSALTAVDLDHQAFLGSTVADIAREKAGIARRGKPFVLGPQKYPEVAGVVAEVVTSAGAELFVARPAQKESLDTSPPSSLSQALRPQPVKVTIASFMEPFLVQLPLHGDHQLDNLGVAVKIIDALLAHPSCTISPSFGDQITRGIESTSWPGRLSFHYVPFDRLQLKKPEAITTEQSMLVLADGAHNPSSSQTLASYVSQLLANITAPDKIQLTYILALSQSPPKTPTQTLTPLLTLPSEIRSRVDLRVGLLRFTPVEGMPWVRSVPPSELKQAVEDISPGAVGWSASDEDPVDRQILEALRWASGRTGDRVTGGEDRGLVVVAGSLYLVADFYRVLQNI